MKEILIKNISELKIAAQEIIKLIENNNIFGFYGELGAGKTSLIKVICEQLKVEDYVTSPTFSIVNEYYSPAHGKIYHFDFYRIESVKEVYDIGIEEYFNQNCIVFIEWPELAEEVIPEKHLKIKITSTSVNSRSILILS